MSSRVTTEVPEQVPSATGRELLVTGPRRRLVMASALMLFLELALIRWLGANIVHLGTSAISCCSAASSASAWASCASRPGRRAPCTSRSCSRRSRSSCGCPRHRGAQRGRPRLLHLPVAPRAAGVAHAARGVPRRRRRHGRPRRARRGLLPAAGTSRGLPLRPDRQPRGHLGLHALSFLRAPSVVWGPSWRSQRRAAAAPAHASSPGSSTALVAAALVVLRLLGRRR